MKSLWPIPSSEARANLDVKISWKSVGIADRVPMTEQGANVASSINPQGDLAPGEAVRGRDADLSCGETMSGSISARTRTESTVVRSCTRGEG